MQIEPELASDFRILIADDHALFRGGLTQLVGMIDESIDTIEADSFEEMTTILSDGSDIDLILLDLMMSGVQDLTGLEQLREKWPEIPVIVVSAKEDAATIREALEKGAMGFIPKSSASNVTSGAIRLVLSGGIYVPPMLIAQSISTASDAFGGEKAGPKYSDFGLTDRQVDVLKLLSLGKSNNDIADQLGLTSGTIKMHVSRIFKVLEVGNRTRAAAKFGEIEKAVS